MTRFIGQMEENALLTIGQYTRPESLDEAYALCQKKNNVVLGGMLWLKMQHRNAGTVIDLCDLGLDTIEEDETAYRIGAMVSLRALEQHAGLAALTGGAMAHAVRHIVGVQFRNCATLGGSLWGRFGFSDVLTLLLALDARVHLHHAGEMPLADFAALPRTTRDILTHVTIPKAQGRVVYLSQRNISTDFPVLTCALARAGRAVHLRDRRAPHARRGVCGREGPARAGHHRGQRPRICGRHRRARRVRQQYARERGLPPRDLPRARAPRSARTGQGGIMAWRSN